MKIIFIGGRNIHTLGGIETYMRNLATELVKIGHVPVVYCESDHNGKEWLNGFWVIHQRSIKNIYLCKSLLGLKATMDSLIKHRDAKIYHYNSWGPAIGSLIPSLFGKKVIIQGHGLEWKRTKYSLMQQRILKIYEKIIVCMNRYIIAVSQEQTDFFLLNYGKNCTTIPTAVHLPDSEVIQSDILDRYNVEDNNYFLFLGRLVQDKNPDCLIKAYIQSNIKDKKLVIAGTNENLPHYVEDLHRLGAENRNIVFTGAVYGNDKETLLQHCFVFCIPSSVEGLSITLFEAMSYRKPVLASDISSNRESLENNAIWVKPEDVKDLSEKLIYCIENIDILEYHKEQNYQRIVNNFTWDIIVKKYIEYINMILRHDKNNGFK